MKYIFNFSVFNTHPWEFTVPRAYRNDIPDHLIISATNIQLMDPIGQGIYAVICRHCKIHGESYKIFSRNNVIISYTGEFGVVYKGHIVKDLGQTITDVVAVKTLKGTCIPA